MSERVIGNKYEIQEQIGQGAMGIVYKALDRELGRVVALKVLHPHLTSDTSFLQRFRDEAKKMARLTHENIVAIHNVGQDRGTHFIDMEYFPGTNLTNKIQPNTCLPLSQAISIIHKIGKALAAAHKEGIIHRDVKPANVLMSNDNRIKLTDFGVARTLDDPALTTAGQLIGNLLYMAPEQAHDQALDGRADLYALGLMLYEMLTGTHPRRNLSNTAILSQIDTGENASPLGFPPDLRIPTEVQTLVHDLLRYRPKDRISDVQLLAQLEPLLNFERPTAHLSGNVAALPSDATICDLPEFPGQVVAPPRKTNQPAEKKQHRTLSPGTKAAIAFGTIAALALGFVGLNSMSPSQSVSSRAVTEVQVDPKEAQERLEGLRQSVTAKNLAEIDKISVMSEDRRGWLEDLFRSYSTIEASLGEIVATPADITTVLRIDKLILPNGDPFPIGPALQKIRLNVPREGDGWGKIKW